MANETSNRAYIVKEGDEFDICMPDLSSEMPRFASEDEFTKFVADWPGSRLIELWNRLPGVVPVKKFTDRKTAVRRIWVELENPGGAKPAPTAKRKKPPVSKRPGSKADAVLSLLRQPGGATIEALMSATGWQAHSVRGFISGQLTKKMRLKVKSFKRDGQRVYSVRS